MTHCPNCGILLIGYFKYSAGYPVYIKECKRCGFTTEGKVTISNHTNYTKQDIIIDNKTTEVSSK